MNSLQDVVLLKAPGNDSDRAGLVNLFYRPVKWAALVDFLDSSSSDDVFASLILAPLAVDHGACHW